MSKRVSYPPEGVPALSSALWVAWNRDQTEIIGKGHTFEEAKLAAATAGHRAMILTKMAAVGHRSAHRHAIVYAVAVFVAQIMPLLSGS